MLHKKILIASAILYSLNLPAQTCFSISNRTNGNGNPGTCGTPSCSGNAKTGHIDVDFAGSCPGIIPTLQLISVTSGSLPSPFCFDPGNCISPGTVRYCFRGTNLPSSGFMTVRLTQGATTWNCTYDVNGGGGTLLPVKLTGFEAKLQQQQVLIKWNTEQEFNNEEFQVERSSDNETFTSIGTVKGKGTSYTLQHYSFTDKHPLSGISFYRLQQIDIDGHSSFSSILKIDKRIQGLQLKQLFPNPANKEINLQFVAEESSEIDLGIYNLSGSQLLFAHKKLSKGEQTLHIDLPELSSGMYQMVITNNKGGALTEKLVVN